MSLQGTLETFALPDVLALLAATKKTGELRVSSGGSDGRVWLDEGRVVGGQVPRAATLADAVFELLRLGTGTFVFDRGAAAPSPSEPVAVDGLLAEAQSRLATWREIEAVVPSTRCPVRLVPELTEEAVTVSRAQWKALVAVAAGGDVDGVMGRLGLGEFDACRTVKELADAGLVKVEAAPSAPPAPPEPAPAPGPAPAHAEPERAAPRAASPASSPEPAPSAPAPPPRVAGRSAPGEERPAASVGAGDVPSHPHIRRAAHRPSEAAPAPATSPPGRRPAAPAPVGAPAGRDHDRRPSARPSREEAEELVHQLASLGRAAANGPKHDAKDPVPDDSAGKAAPAKDQPARDESGPKDPSGKAPAKEPGKGPRGKGPHDTDEESDEKAPARAESAEEPINRGMLLKFLSSVRP